MIAGADLQGAGGLKPPLQLVHQWKYGEGEGEEEVDLHFFIAIHNTDFVVISRMVN